MPFSRYLNSEALRNFAKEKRPSKKYPRSSPRSAGYVPGCHHMAAGKAADAVYGVEALPTARKLRELFYMAHFVHSHIAHFYALAAPDFVARAHEARQLSGILSALSGRWGSRSVQRSSSSEDLLRK